jgi:hypothetical protein
MPLAEAYRKQVALLIKIVPLVAAQPAFALKGGTAINLFLREMRRVSVPTRWCAGSGSVFAGTGEVCPVNQEELGGRRSSSRFAG